MTRCRSTVTTVSSTKGKSLQKKAAACESRTQSPSIPKKSDKSTSCVGCGVAIGAETRALQCDQCCSTQNVWKCIDCLNISADLYSMLMVASCAELLWICDSCKDGNEKSHNGKDTDEKITKMMEQLNDISTRLTLYEEIMKQKADRSEFLSCQAKMETMEQKIADFAQEMEQTRSIMTQHLQECKKQENLIEMTQNDHIRHSNSSSIQGPANITTSTDNIESNIAEIQNREKRKKNLILFNLVESSSDNPEQRKKDDESLVDQLLTGELKTVTNIDKIVRLGVRIPSPIRSRPVCVTVGSEQDKWKVLRTANGPYSPLSKNELFHNVFIKKDMTPMEREMESRLRQQLAEKRRTSEETGDGRKWAIKRGQIIQVHS